MPLVTLTTGVCGTVLTDKLGIPLVLPLVLFKANKAFVHGVLHVVRGNRINFTTIWRSPELGRAHCAHIV
jgi:hypothetical protein